MSDHKQITAALNRIFNEEGQRIVFWDDPDREFTNSLGSLDLTDVTTLQLDQIGSLEVKIRIEREEPKSKFLIYSPREEPDYEDDWLLDVRLYSRSFRADRASILLQELGLVNQTLRAYLADRRKFFDAKERLQKVKPLIEPTDGAADIDRKMITVLVKAEQPEIFCLVRTIFHAWAEEGSDLDLDNPPAIFGLLGKFDLEMSFWQMIKTTFGYEDENPSLKNLLLRMLVTDFAHHLKAGLPQSIRGLLLPRIGWANTVVCLGHWRQFRNQSESYDRLSALAAAILKIEDHLLDFEIAHLQNLMTFLAVEKRIASCLRQWVQTASDTINADEVRVIAAQRQTGHWASVNVPESIDAPRKALNAVYNALVAAAEFNSLRNKYRAGFNYPDANNMYHAYETELYRFDQLYRHFCEAADITEAEGIGILKSLRPEIEAHYNNWYLFNLSLAWGRFIEPSEGLLKRWRIEDIPNQYRFYESHVRPYLDAADNRRAFVIISDGFRYEAAQELVNELNGHYTFDATLSSQLGVLPSYTALGMASLLPHKTLTYSGSDVLVDGKSSVANKRDTILQGIGGMACRAKDLMIKKKEEGREFVKDKRVVYIYHDIVDASGDTQKTEGSTFEAVRRAIKELSALVRYIFSNLGNHVVITADHGFMFTESAPGEIDRSKLLDKPTNAIREKKRYIIAANLPHNDLVWHGKLSATARIEGDLEFWIPKGCSLFHFVGGARFFHGGAMPQEIVVPVVTIKQVKGRSAQETRITKVGVQVLGTNHRITTATFRFQLIQMDAVSERVKPITIKVAVYDRSEAITDIQTVKFESSSGNLDDRKKWVTFTLKDRQYDKRTPYRLVLTDSDTNMELQSIEVIIDRAFSDDF